MLLTLAEIASLTGGQACGPPETRLSGAAPLAEAGPTDVTLIDAAEKASRLAKFQVGAALVPRGFGETPVPIVRVDDVHAAFILVLNQFRPARAEVRHGAHPSALVSPSARLEADVEIHAGVVVGDDVTIGAGSTLHAGVVVQAGCRIGRQVTLFPRAVLYENTRVGDRCRVHAGVVLGGDGFGYRLVEGRHQLAAQLGWVELAADVEIGAGTTIDRGTYGATYIGEGTKIDNLVMIAHNCRLGRHNLICSQVGIAGSTTTGDYVIMAGQVGVKDHVHVGDRAILGAKAGVHHDVPPAITVFGAPARPEREQRLIFAATARLPEMRKQLKELAVQVAKLERQHSELAAGHDPSSTAGQRTGIVPAESIRPVSATAAEPKSPDVERAA